ncbi:MAG: hypothetical protein HY558_06175 [Euryarchaeota archaeon]|nr:hypothetical protein [Euryarchaeota archaeon]
MSPEPIADRILAIDHRIGSVLVVDSKGKVQEFKNIAREMPIPESVLRTMGGMWAAIMADIVEKTQAFFGKADHITLRMEKLDIYGLFTAGRIVIVTARRDLPENTVDKIRAIVK